MTAEPLWLRHINQNLKFLHKTSHYLTLLSPLFTFSILLLLFSATLMDSSEQHRRRRKPNNIGRPFYYYYFSSRSLFLCFSFFLFLFFFSSSSHRISLTTSYFHFRPSSNYLTASSSSSSTFSLLYSHNSLLRSSFKILHRILFPDHLILILTGAAADARRSSNLECVYYDQILPLLSQPIISTDRFDELRCFVRCPIPPANYSPSAVELRRRGEETHRNLTTSTTVVYSWDNLAYEAYLDEDEDTVLIFVKGLNLQPHKISDPTRIRCHFGFKDGEFFLTTNAVSAAQEVVRCSLPRSIAKNPNKANEIRVTVSRSGLKPNRRNPTGQPVPSVATIQTRNRATSKQNQKHVLCACTMLKNQASSLKEWITYHSYLGVERWFIYDNNSDDNLESVIKDLKNLGNHNITRKPWPWMKTQEAGFSHCAITSKPHCKWISFFDVDEFFNLKHKSPNSLKSLISKISESPKVAEIRTSCRSFGPSGLSSPPKRGVTVEYTCRLKNSERHKSIVRPELLHSSLLNVVHHFEVKEGMRSVQMKEEEEGVMNHYKYQVWESFKAKFERRVATYVVDWREERNTRSKDRAPGLGTEAVEPPDWRFRFCEVSDTALRDFVVPNFQDPTNGRLPWD